MQVQLIIYNIIIYHNKYNFACKINFCEDLSFFSYFIAININSSLQLWDCMGERGGSMVLVVIGNLQS